MSFTYTRCILCSYLLSCKKDFHEVVHHRPWHWWKRYRYQEVWHCLSTMFMFIACNESNKPLCLKRSKVLIAVIILPNITVFLTCKIYIKETYPLFSNIKCYIKKNNTFFSITRHHILGRSSILLNIIKITLVILNRYVTW